MQKPLTEVEEAPSLKFDPLSGHKNHLRRLKAEPHSLTADILTTLVNLHNDKPVMAENS